MRVLKDDFGVVLTNDNYAQTFEQASFETSKTPKDYHGFYPYDWDKCKEGIWEFDPKLVAKVDAFLVQETNFQNIQNAQQYLLETDYKAMKAFEGDPSDDWEEVKQKRAEARAKINQLEKELKQS